MIFPFDAEIREYVANGARGTNHYLQFLYDEDIALVGELNNFSVLEGEVVHKFLRDIEPPGSFGVYEYFSNSNIAHDYMDIHIFKYKNTGVNKCKHYIAKIYYIGVNEWSIWKIRRGLIN
jgi:hypothetical protein